MKKFFSFAMLATFASSSFAYSDYSSNDGTSVMTFLSFLLIAWGVLQIILFFKIWGMTNDIKQMDQN